MNPESGYTVRVFESPPFYENTYLVEDAGGHCVVIDPGGSAEQLVRLLEAEQREPLAVLLTHAHVDHVSGVARLRQRWSVPVYLHGADLDLYRRAPEQPAWLGLDLEVPDPPEPDHLVTDREVLTFGDLRFEVIHTPGHTPGSVCYRLERALFTGDTLFAGSIGRTDLPGGSYTEILRSIMTRIVPLGDDVVLYPGHGPQSTVGRERLTNPFLQIPYVPL